MLQWSGMCHDIQRRTEEKIGMEERDRQAMRVIREREKEKQTELL